MSREKLSEFLKPGLGKIIVFVLIVIIAFVFGASNNVLCDRPCLAAMHIACDPSGIERTMPVLEDTDICPEGEFPGCNYSINPVIWAPSFLPAILSNTAPLYHCGFFNLENDFAVTMPLTIVYWYLASCLIASGFNKVKKSKRD